MVADRQTLIRRRAERLHAEAIRKAEENDHITDPMFKHAPVCMSTFEAAVVATDVLWLLDQLPDLKTSKGSEEK